jgi:predicted ATPase/class 3 adenylate cyclase
VIVAELPTGTVTFLLTDVEGSTRLWEQHPAGMRLAAARHDALVEEIVGGHGGVVVRPRGEGDSRFAVFARATDAVTAAAVLQRSLTTERWPIAQPLRVRMALHTGEADLREGDYYGAAVNRCARLRAIAHGGQVLLSQTTHDLVRQALPAGVSLWDLGEHRLRDVLQPEQVYQLCHADLPRDFPPLASLDIYPHNLPLQLTSFVGRTAEIAEVGRLLGGTRLLTLTGTGGCGKTRLALRVAEELVEGYPDGVWLIELAPLADSSLIPQAVASVVGVHEIAGRDLTSVLVDGLRSRQALLIFDNCEHLTENCVRVIEALLRGCPRIRILATSREILGAVGETVWRVPSLPTLDPRQLPGPAPALLALVATSDAAQLFVERARQVVPSFAATADNAAALAQICFRLDGIPLAIELAAARVRTLSVEQLAARLDHRFRLLTGGSRTALRRQQTLQALVDWSHDLLSLREQTLFRRLAVFAGGWQLDAAEQICVGGEVDAPDVLDLLTSLADKSLVVVDNAAGGELRYRLLETLREYALERLAVAEEAEAVHRAHAQYYQALGEREIADLWVRRDYLGKRFLVEIDNFRAGLRWLAETRDWDGCLSLIASLGVFWTFGGHLGESESWLNLAIEHRREATPTTRGRALIEVGRLAYARGDFATAEKILRESLRVCRQIGDRRWLARASNTLGNVLRDGSKLDEATIVLEESLRHYHEAKLSIAPALYQLGLLARQKGDLAQARSLLTDAARSAQDSGLITGFLGAISQNLGLVAEDEGALVEARTFYTRSFPLMGEAGFHWLQPYTIEGSRLLLIVRGNPRSVSFSPAPRPSLASRLGVPSRFIWRYV